MPDKESVHRLAIKRFDRVTTDERDQRDKAIEDAEFAQVEGSQWDDDANQKRTDRPRFEINKIALPVNQAIGDQRQSRISVKVRPATSGTDEELAKTYAGLIRNIEINSKFNKVKDNAYKEIVNGGLGGWYITTEFSDDDSFDQDIVIKKITSAATSVYMEATNKEDNKKGSNWGFVIEEISDEDFKERWPDAVLDDFSSNDQPTNYRSGWRMQDTVRIADYWVRKQVDKEIALFTNGKVYELSKETKSVLDELKRDGITISTDANGNPKTRKIKSHEVIHYKMSGAEILEGPNKWAGKYIPIVLAYGYNMWINGRHYFRGMVRHAKDPQRVYNYATSQAIESSALSPKDPFWVTPKQIQGYQRQFEAFNTSNNPFMVFNPDPEMPGPPQRTGAPAVQTAIIQQIAQADADIQATTGRFAPSLGDNPQDQSGRAVIAVQQQGETGTYELSDNLAGAVEFTGEILVDLIPKIYDTSRQIRIINPDDTTDLIEVNKTVYDEQTKKEVLLNDLSQGKYSVVVDTGPSYKTQRTEALNFLNALSESSPIFQQVAPDLMAKNIDFEFSEELTERIRSILLQQGVVKPNEKEQEAIAQEQAQQAQQPPNPLEMMAFEKLKLELEELAANVDKIDLQNQEIKANIANTMADTNSKMAGVDKTNAETAKTMVESGTMVEINPDELAENEMISSINQSVALDIEQMDMEEQQQEQQQEMQQAQQQQAEQQGFEQGMSQPQQGGQLPPEIAQETELT